jgi:hypothetical protein
MEGISKIKCLLGVELYEISDKFIYNMRIAQKNRQDVFKNLPKYTINTNDAQHNQVVTAEEFHQFVGLFPNDTKNDFYVYFNLNTLDRTLQEEIDNAGIEDLFKKFDFLKYLIKFVPQSEDDLSKFVFPRTNYLIVELTYDVTYDHYNGGYDCDMDVDITGYLDSNLNAIYFN